MDQPGFFDLDERLTRLSGLGDQLKAFSRAVDFKLFRPELERALSYSDGSKGRRPPFDPVIMFKILVIQMINTLSDERIEYLINDRLSFMRFLGLGLSDRVPGCCCMDAAAMSTQGPATASKFLGFSRSMCPVETPAKQRASTIEGRSALLHWSTTILARPSSTPSHATLHCPIEDIQRPLPRVPTYGDL